MSCASGLISDQCATNLTGLSAHLFLTLINTLMSTKCAFQPESKYPPDYGPQIKDNDEFDFIIIGSGSAGSVVANKLSENKKWKILVLEAGGYPPSTSEIPALMFGLQGTDTDWQYTTESSQQSSLSLKNGKGCWPRGKGLGGSGIINAMIYLRGNRRDYDQWAEQGNRNWNYDNVLEYFKVNENFQSTNFLTSRYYGQNGYQTLSTTDQSDNNPLKERIKESAEELGYPKIVEENDGLGFFQSINTIADGLRANPAASFLGKVKDRKNLLVATNAFVEELIEVAPKSFRGVLVQIGNNLHKKRLFAKHEVIVSAGSINSPQLLMLSGIGPKKHLEAKGIDVRQDLQVGKNLQDHLIEVGFWVKLIKWPTHLNPQPQQIIDDIYKYFMYHQGPLSRIGITNFVGFINTKNDSIYPNIQYHHAFYPQNDNYLLSQISKASCIADDVAKTYVDINKDFSILNIIPTLLNPKSHGEILLKSKNPREKPLIYPNYLKESADLETLLEAIRFLERLIETKAFEEYQPEIADFKLANCTQYEFRSDDYWRCNLRHLSMTIYHPVGTCKMGPKTDRNAVVDDRLRVHGIKNLRVVDASIMPTIISANTQAAAMMIGQKAAAMILEDWQQQQTEHNEL